MSESNLPPNLHALIHSGGDWMLPGITDEQCQGARHHSPRPMAVHDVLLVLPGWWADADPRSTPWADAPRAYVCGTCHDNLIIMLRVLHATNGQAEWALRREFGNDLRALARRGWAWYVEKFLETDQAG